MSSTMKLLILGIALAVVSNYFLYRMEVECEDSGGTYVRSVFGYKCIGGKP